MFRHIRSRLIAAFAVPLALLLAVTSAAAWASYRTESSTTQETDLAVAANGPSGIVDALQNERDEATAGLIGVAGPRQLPVKSNAEARQRTDAALAAFRSSVDGGGAATEAIFRPALSGLSRLSTVRRDVDDFSGARSIDDAKARAAEQAVFGDYASLIGNFLSSVTKAPPHVSDPTLRSSLQTLDIFLNQSEALTVISQQILQSPVLQSPVLHSQPHQVTPIPASAFGAFDAFNTELSGYTNGADGATVATVITAADNTSMAMLPYLQTATAGLPTDPTAFDRAVSRATTGRSGENIWLQASTAIGQHISARATSLRHQANTRVLLYSAAALISVLIGVLVLLRVSRSISKPLTRLAADARRMAEVDLPAAVEAIFTASTSPDASPATDPEQEPAAPRTTGRGLAEIDDVAGAFEDVQHKALELATEQATLRRKVADAFVNLGRRNQNLVSRQLELITHIEQKEDDPNTLEDLFRLDHLTTRMRRQAESLLVIAGSGALRPWAEAASAADVVRAASAEVEEYQRLRLHHFDHAVVAASVTTDLIHILAELMENGLAFSPPHSSVGLYGRALESGYTISVVDAGIGMSTEAREASNHRLSSGGDLDDAANRYLGLVVAGRLAARHGIVVTLHDSEAGGVAARVRIPAALIESSVAGPAEMGTAPVELDPPAHPNLAATPPSVLPAAITRPSSEPFPLPEGMHFQAVALVPHDIPRTDGSQFGIRGSLPRRVPGATLDTGDDSLRRNRVSDTPTPRAVSYALSDYLNNYAEPPEGRPSPESQ
jgi:signal transduction histidine kinase